MLSLPLETFVPKKPHSQETSSQSIWSHNSFISKIGLQNLQKRAFSNTPKSKTAKSPHRPHSQRSYPKIMLNKNYQRNDSSVITRKYAQKRVSRNPLKERSPKTLPQKSFPLQEIVTQNLTDPPNPLEKTARQN